MENSGVTRSYVYQGKIKLQSKNSRESTTPGELSKDVVQLIAGESARVVKSFNGRRLIVARVSLSADEFVRVGDLTKLLGAAGGSSASAQNTGRTRGT